MIGIGQTEALINWAKNHGHYGILKEMERIGSINLMNCLGQDQKKRLYHYMLSDQPSEALKLLSLLPNKENI